MYYSLVTHSRFCLCLDKNQNRTVICLESVVQMFTFQWDIYSHPFDVSPRASSRRYKGERWAERLWGAGTGDTLLNSIIYFYTHRYPCCRTRDLWDLGRTCQEKLEKNPSQPHKKTLKPRKKLAPDCLMQFSKFQARLKCWVNLMKLKTNRYNCILSFRKIHSRGNKRM